MADLKTVLGRLDKDLAESLVDAMTTHGVPLTDPSFQAFLERVDVMDRLQQQQLDELRGALEQALNARVDPIDIEAAEVARLVVAKIGTGSSSPPLLPYLGAAGFGLSIGLAIAAGAVYTHFLPQAIASSRLQDAEDIQYLHGAEGQLFKKIVRLNSGYLDTQDCVKEATRQKLFLTRGKRKIDRVCVLAVP